MTTRSLSQATQATRPATRHQHKAAQAGNTTPVRPVRTDTTSQDAGLIEYRSWLELLWAQRAAATAG